MKLITIKSFFFGSAETTFKERYNNHKRDVKYIKYQYNIELTKYIWNLKSNRIKYNNQWKVVDKVHGNANSTICKLCLTEKLWIINHIMITTYWIKSQNLLINADILKKFLLKHVKEKQWTFVLCVVVFCIFLVNITNSFVYFVIAFAWNSELHEYLSFIFPFLNIYIHTYIYVSVYACAYLHTTVMAKGCPEKQIV